MSRNPESRASKNRRRQTRAATASLATVVRVEITGIYGEFNILIRFESRCISTARVYNLLVTAILQFIMHVLTFLFFLGMAGSSVVVMLSFVEDLNELLGLS